MGVSFASDIDPKALIKESVDAMGGRDAFYEKGGAQYTYTYTKPGDKTDISEEIYRFRDEFSQATYSRRNLLFPDEKGKMVQIYDGKKVRVSLDGNPVSDAKIIKRSDFMRKTNFYWFSMMFKLLDPGLIYSYEGKQTVDGIDYQKVKIHFEDGIGDVKDTYLVYINPQTKLIDFFLFTILDFGKTDPFLMKVGYETVDGIKLPTKRKYTPAKDWEANHNPEGPWVLEISTQVKFGNFIQ